MSDSSESSEHSIIEKAVKEVQSQANAIKKDLSALRETRPRPIRRALQKRVDELTSGRRRFRKRD